MPTPLTLTARATSIDSSVRRAEGGPFVCVHCGQQVAPSDRVATDGLFCCWECVNELQPPGAQGFAWLRSALELSG